MTARVIREFGGVRIATVDWPLVVVEFPEKRIADSALAEVLAYVEQLMHEAKRGDEGIYQITDLTKVRELAPATQRKYAAGWSKRTIALQRETFVGGANVTPSKLLRGLITAIHWFQPPPTRTVCVATRVEASVAALKAFDAAMVTLPEELRARLRLG